MNEKMTKITWRDLLEKVHRKIPTDARVHFFTENGSRLDVWIVGKNAIRVSAFDDDISITPIATNTIEIKPQ